MTTKDDLRQMAKVKRSKFDSSLASDDIVKNILRWDEFLSAKNVMIYYPIKNEINLLGLLGEKNFFFPKLIDGEISVCPYDGKNSFSIGKFGIPEPLSDNISDLSVLDIVFVPAIAADRWGYRIGYGCGYYDRFLERLGDKTIKIIPIYHELLFDNIPFEFHDQKADFVVTENGVFSTSMKIAR